MKPVQPLGIVFDLQRFSLHDGPGIRTTVFLKGCPLRCQWCHNPESQRRGVEISFRADACEVCGACVHACENSAHAIEHGVHLYDRSLCVRCGECIEVCVFEALKIAGEERTVESVLAEVLRDEPYYRQSGGGLTLSGGEPLAQFAFSKALLQAARAASIHTCIETSGHAPLHMYEELLPLVDLFLLDYKASGEALHRELTGVGSGLVLATLDYLQAQGARVRLRCPLVPGVNDSREHLAGIAALEQKYPNLDGIEIMAYHNVGNSKYDRYALENPLPELETAGEEIKQGWLESLRALGCVKITMG